MKFLYKMYKSCFLRIITYKKFKELNIFNGKKFTDISLFEFRIVTFNEELEEELFMYLCKNKNIPVNVLINHEYEKYHNESLSSRCTLEEFLKYPKLINFCIFYNDNIPISYKLKYLYLNVMFNFTYTKTKLTMRDIFMYNLLDHDKYHFYFDYPVEFFLLYPSIYTQFYNCSFEELKKIVVHPTLKYLIDWCNVSNSINITIEDVLTTINDNNYKWHYNMIRNTTIDFYKQLSIDVNTDDHYLIRLSSSNRITIINVLNNPDISWDYNYLLTNPNITDKIINNYKLFLDNSNITNKINKSIIRSDNWYLYHLNEQNEPEKFRLLISKFQTELINEIKLFPLTEIL